MKKFLHEYLKYDDNIIVDNGWWEIKGDRLVNIVGGWHPYKPNNDDIIVEVDNVLDLDWSCLINNSRSTGWLDLNGVFYGCEKFEHSMLATYYFKSDERTLEKLGFIKLYDCSLSQKYKSIDWYCEKSEPTTKQKNWLLENGFIKEC